MKVWGAMILALLPTPQDDKAARQLLDDVRQRIETASSLRVEFQVEVTNGARSQGTVRGMAVLQGKDRWRIELDARGTDDRDNDISLKLFCDGRKVLSETGSRTGLQALGPEGGGRQIRDGLSTSLFSLILYAQPVERGGLDLVDLMGLPRLSVVEARDGGKEKVGDKDARVIEYFLKDARDVEDKEKIKVRLAVDPVGKRPLRREVVFFGCQLVETFPRFAVGEALADSEFAFLTPRRLAAARAAQLSRSAELFGRFTGRPARGWEDLARRPADLAADVFYPEGGYLLGAAVPKDAWGRPFELAEEKGCLGILSRGADGKAGGRGEDEDVFAPLPPTTGQAVGAPTERLLLYFTGRVQVQLLAAAVRAYAGANGELPRKKAALGEAGWLPGGQVPVDPWGDAYRIVSEAEFVRVQVADPAARRLAAKQVTAEERAALDATAQPRLSADQKRDLRTLLEELANDDLEGRARAEERIRSMGLAVVPALEERMKVEKDGEARARLADIRKSIRVPPAPWAKELAPLSETVRLGGRATAASTSANERNASASLKTLASAQADFRANDRDGNRVQDFWTADVASLYTLVPTGGKDSIKLIEAAVAAADAAPLDEGVEIEKRAERGPKAGYHFRVMTHDRSGGAPEAYLQDTGGPGGRGKVYNTSKFGFCAYPAEYGASGTKTFILNEGNTVFWKDTGGEPVLEWPTDEELRADWQRLD